MRQAIWEFGKKTGRTDLAEIVQDLYDAALKQSSRQTYGTGQRAYLRFASELNFPNALVPFHPDKLTNTELCLSFYIAYLMLKSTITKASTILNYETHVKYAFREQGCHPSDYSTPFLKQIRRGVNNTYPEQADKRVAFLLPNYVSATAYMTPITKEDYHLRLATVMGFIGMLRPNTFDQLGPESISFVLQDETTVTRYERHFDRRVRELPLNASILGYFIRFKSKTMQNALAYFPNLSSIQGSLSKMCPVTLLTHMERQGWVKQAFLKKYGKGAKLGQYIQLLTSSEKQVSPYALRIGGRTWYISKGMERQFTDYLGTWKSPEASARYYRESPATVLKILLSFYRDIGRNKTSSQ